MLKSQMQVQIIREKTVPNFKPEFTGVFDALAKITKANGLLGLYQVRPPRRTESRHVCIIKTLDLRSKTILLARFDASADSHRSISGAMD